MPSTDLRLPMGTGVAQGWTHQTRRQVRLLERRGEIRAQWQAERVNVRYGTTVIPYVRLKTRAQVRRRQAIRIGAMSAGALVFLSAVALLLWESRFVIMAVAGVMLAAVLLRFVLHWTNGCPGLHCSGCRG